MTCKEMKTKRWKGGNNLEEKAEKGKQRNIKKQMKRKEIKTKNGGEKT